MANKRLVDELDLQPERADGLRRAEGDVTCNAQEICARSDDAGPSHQSREACVDVADPAWPKHKIFLSHSGVQKPFTERLCEELKRVYHSPFFDIHADSLRKGERFFVPLMTAAQRCRVAVLVLSEEFFTASKWPMMEVNEFVKAQKLDERVRILPLYLKISREELGERDRQARWIEGWKVMASEDKSVDVEEWECALRHIPGNNGMAYGGNTEGEAAFIRRVVKAVCDLVLPDVRWDVSHVQSREELSEPILRKLKDVKPREESKARVVGLYGTGGAGKTTISSAICNEMFAEFVGKVCYIEFGKFDVEELQRKVLQELTEASPAFLRNRQRGQLLSLMKDRICGHKVFLVLDNVLDDYTCDAKMFLDVRYCDGSMVLVTSRSLDMLNALGIKGGDCMEMPNLEEEGAIDVFLHYAERRRESVEDKEWEVIRGCVQECHFMKKSDLGCGRVGTYHYLPLALKVLGVQLRSLGTDVVLWKEKLDAAQKGIGEKFNMLKKKTHPIFSVLRLGYDSLCLEEQHIFLDLALFFPSFKMGYVFWDLDAWLWMGVMHKKTKVEIQASLRTLQWNGLLDVVYIGEKLNVNIHDLYKEFAEAESQGGPFEGRHSLFSLEAGDRVVKQVLKYPPNGLCWSSLRRLVIWKSKVCNLRGAYLRFCRNVELLDLRWCAELEVVDVSGMDNLRCMMVYGCPMLREWIGLETLQDLSILRFSGYNVKDPLMPSFLQKLSSLTALQLLELRHQFCSNVDTFLLDLSACTNLQELYVSHVSRYFGLELGVQDLGKCLPASLRWIDFSGFSELVGSSPFRSMHSLTNLQKLKLPRCFEIEDLTGLCELTLLQKLNVSRTEIRELPSNMRALENLEVLDVSHCTNLSSLVGISQCATTLRRLNASGCARLRDLPDDFSCFQKLERIDLELCELICTLPKGYERLARHPGSGSWILGAEGCYGLIVPLVKMMRLPEKSHVKCVDPCNFGGDSMQLWIDGWKHANNVAYELLRRVFDKDFRDIHGFWTYMLDEGEMVDLFIRALFEHDDRGVNRLMYVVQAAFSGDFATDCYGPSCGWWMVVMTAPCTFGVVIEKATLLEPWRSTLLHYTISFILPGYVCYRQAIVGREDLNCMEVIGWLDMAMKTLLQKCRENVEDAIGAGILPMHSSEGKKVVDIILGAIAAANGQEVGFGGILWVHVGWLGFRPSYRQRFPNFPFETALRRICMNVEEVDEGGDVEGEGDDGGEVDDEVDDVIGKDDD